MERSRSLNASWDFACPDWWERLQAGRSLIPDLPLDEDEADRAAKIFDRMCLPDVPGRPVMRDAAGDWQRDLARIIGGSVVEGVRRVPEMFVMVPKKNSKALALDTLVATPAGFTTIGEINVGDLVIGADGAPTHVVEKSKIFTRRLCFEVEFSSGETVVCDAEHLWVTDAHRDREQQPRHKRSTPRPSAKRTDEIAASLTVPSGRLTISNHRTALAPALDLPAAELPIPPYALGVWLGDGATAAPIVTTGCGEADATAARLVACGQPAYVRARYPDKGSATVALTTKGAAPSAKLPYRFATEARRLGLVGNKHIPQAYLRGSYQQRLDLLRGLMDTDGSISVRGQATFVTTLPGLRDDAVELVASLGLKPTVSSSIPKIGWKAYKRAWRVQFTPYDDVPVFQIERKAARQKPRPRRVTVRSQTRQIVAVRPTASVPTQCLRVASEAHQFLVTRSLIPTHNTTGGAALSLTYALMNRRPRAEMIYAGPTQEVADLAFGQAEGMIEGDETGFLGKRFHVAHHNKLITDLRTKSELKIKTFDMKVVTGSKPVFVLLDELHIMSNMSAASRIITQIRGGLEVNPESLLLIITTQSDQPPAGAFKTELTYARGIRDGKIKDGRMLPVLYEFPREIQTDSDKGNEAWRNQKLWPAIHPNLGRSRSLDRLVAGYRQARDNGVEEMQRWASQHLNIEIGMALNSQRWIGADWWEPQASPAMTLENIMAWSDVICAGIDGGGLDDLLALAVLGRDRDTRDWMLWTKAWAHTSVLERRKDISPRLRDFAAAGEMVIVDKIGDDVDDLINIVTQIDEAGLLGMVGVDPAGIGAIVDALAERKIGGEDDPHKRTRGDRVVGVSQGWRLTGAIKTAERKLADNTLWHAGQALMSWAVGNAKQEPRGSAVVITKQTSGTAKIDPLLAAFDAVALMANNPAPMVRPIAYEKGSMFL